MTAVIPGGGYIETHSFQGNPSQSYWHRPTNEPGVLPYHAPVGRGAAGSHMLKAAYGGVVTRQKEQMRKALSCKGAAGKCPKGHKVCTCGGMK